MSRIEVCKMGATCTFDRGFIFIEDKVIHETVFVTRMYGGFRYVAHVRGIRVSRCSYPCWGSRVGCRKKR